MADEKQPKVTIWLARHGYKDAKTAEEMRNPEPLYSVQRTQNTTFPRISDRLDEAAIEGLIFEGVTVNIS